MEPERSKSTVYFDGSCPLCQAEIGYYRRKDQAGAFCFVCSPSAPMRPFEGLHEGRIVRRQVI